jgi:hypothetical protein
VREILGTIAISAYDAHAVCGVCIRRVYSLVRCQSRAKIKLKTKAASPK